MAIFGICELCSALKLTALFQGMICDIHSGYDIFKYFQVPLEKLDMMKDEKSKHGNKKYNNLSSEGVPIDEAGENESQSKKEVISNGGLNNKNICQ